VNGWDVTRGGEGWSRKERDGEGWRGMKRGGEIKRGLTMDDGEVTNRLQLYQVRIPNTARIVRPTPPHIPTDPRQQQI